MSQDNARQAGLTDQAIVELARRHNIHTVDGWNIFVHERHAGHDAVVQFAHAVIADFLDRAGQYVTNDASREAAIADALAAQSADASNAAPTKLDAGMLATIREAANSRAEGAITQDGRAVFINYGDGERQMTEAADMACPHCGGSGHKDDVPAPAAQAEPFGFASPTQGNYFTRNKTIADRIGGLIPVYASPQHQSGEEGRMRGMRRPTVGSTPRRLPIFLRQSTTKHFTSANAGAPKATPERPTRTGSGCSATWAARRCARRISKSCCTTSSQQPLPV
ncbi:hypothetical protein [Cupriavidus sp. EM10]|uniref:hypothetical protein n=2 Tax=unclassified Cupriavidus TaxID=2640874 RepID=UPI001C0081B1|nr:hypothetical protein [Cupriavidus sp. EM10]QWE93327.1 hypothetical protein KLP38_09770 [Cupriavidus sp. EM10]